MITLIKSFIGQYISWYKVAIVAAILSLCTYVYIRDINHRLTIEKLKATVNELSIENAQAKNTIDTYKKDVAKILSSNKRLSKLATELAEERNELEKTLNREMYGKKSLEELAEAKPKLIQKIINNGTEDVFKCLEYLSGGESDEDNPCGD